MNGRIEKSQAVKAGQSVTFTAIEYDLDDYELSGMYSVDDHGLELIDGTDIAVYTVIVYGNNLKNKLERDVLTISQQTLTSAQQDQVMTNIGAKQAIATLNSNFVNLYGNLATGISYQKYGKIVIIYFNGNTVAGSSGWTDLLTLPGNLGQSRYTVHVKAMSGQDVRIGSGNVISYRGSAGDIFGTIVYIQS